MHCTCVRQTELPHTTSLFADVLYHPDRTAAFYPTSRARPGVVSGRRPEIEFSARAARGAGGRAYECRIPQPVARTPGAARDGGGGHGPAGGTVFRPCYTIYKALHAVKLAAWLTDNGIPAVPVFWLATEDHDFAEVNHAWVFDAEHQPRKLEMRRTSVRAAGGRRRPGGAAGARAARRAARPAVRRGGGRPGGGNLSRRQHHGQGVRRAAAQAAGAVRHSAGGPDAAGFPRAGRARACAPRWRRRRN